jgi:prepilin-type N-terminal cleavage/methylation domain-containing protein
LLRIQTSLGPKEVFTKAKKPAEEVAKFGEGFVVIGFEGHRRQLLGVSGGVSRFDTLARQVLIFSIYMNTSAAKSNRGFTLVEIMIVVAIIALLAAIAVPGFLRARKRSQASRILNDLRMIDSAVDQYAIETNRKTGDAVAITDWTNYLKKGSLLYNSGNSLLGTAYGPQTVDTIPQVPPADYTVLSDVAGTGFWSPYGP